MCNLLVFLPVREEVGGFKRVNSWLACLFCCLSAIYVSLSRVCCYYGQLCDRTSPLINKLKYHDVKSLHYIFCT